MSGLCSVFCAASWHDSINQGVYMANGIAVGCFLDGRTRRIPSIFCAAACRKSRLIICDGTPGSCRWGPDHCSSASWMFFYCYDFP